MKNHIPLTSWACEKKIPHVVIMKVSFRAIWETWATPPNISCFLNGKERFWSVYVFFIKKFGVKNKGTILFTNHFDLGWKENSRSHGAFQENCYDFNETAAPPGDSLWTGSLFGEKIARKGKRKFPSRPKACSQATREWVTWVNFCWVCAAGLSELLPHYSLFCGLF